MAKTTLPINKFDGGVNTAVNARDIQPNEFKIGHNVDTVVVGRIKCPGKWDDFYNLRVPETSTVAFPNQGAGNNHDLAMNDGIKMIPGYGIAYVTVDRDVNGAVVSGGGKYIAVFVPDRKAIDFFVNPAVNGTVVMQGTANVNTSHLLIDSTLDASTGFIANDIEIGDAVKNVTAGTTGIVDSIESEIQITLTSDAFPLGTETYQILRDGAHCVANVIDIGASTPSILGGVPQLGDTNYGASASVNFIYADGALRIYDNGNQQPNSWAKPIRWYWWGEGTEYFNNSTDAADFDGGTSFESVDEYLFDHQFVKAPAGGEVVVSTYNDQDPVGSSLSDLNVSLVINVSQSAHSNIFTGWGKGPGENENYTFYASFVYDGTQESLTTELGTTNLGGWGTVEDDEFTGVELATARGNDASFLVEVPVRDNNTGGTIVWNPRITSVRIYYRKSEDDTDLRYYIGNYPCTNPADDPEVAMINVGNITTGQVLLLGEKTGKGTSTYSGAGTYYKEAPRIFTHGVKAGLNADTVSTECKYKTGVILNRRLYVGNILQKTADSPNIEKHYPDRLLKSLSNRFDVLPDNEFIDVAIRDGESIIKLAGIGNRLLQFKENTLYVIAVAGGEEYLEGKYQNMGVRHPNAVVTTEDGIFWVNEFGAFVMLPDKPPVNIVDKKIDKGEWADFITANAIVGYYANEKKLFVIGDSSSVATTTGEQSDVDTYCFNMLTGGWNQQVDVIGLGSNYGKVSNIIDYQSPLGSHHLIVFAGDKATYGNHLLEYLRIGQITSGFGRAFNFVSGEFTADVPHQRKRIYNVYITYRGASVTGNFPEVFFNIVNEDGTELIHLEADVAFAATSGSRGDVGTDSEWKTAKFSPKTADKSKVTNAYGVQIVLRGTRVTATVPTVSGSATLTSGGTYIGTRSRTPYKVQIDGDAPDTFKYYEGEIDSAGAITYGTAIATAIPITGLAQEISNGVTVLFSSTTTGTSGDYWIFEGQVGGDIDQRFEVNDISITYRPKNPK